MNWQQVAANWPSFVPVISDRWPRTEERELEAIDGDRERFEAHLSAAHDLTRAEAHEEVDSWLILAMPASLTMSESRGNASVSASSQHVSSGQDVYPEGDDRLENRPLGRSREG